MSGREINLRQQEQECNQMSKVSLKGLIVGEFSYLLAMTFVDFIVIIDRAAHLLCFVHGLSSTEADEY